MSIPCTYAHRISANRYTDRARDKRSNSIVAMKKVRMERESSGMPISSIREVTLMRRVHHKNIDNLDDNP